MSLERDIKEIKEAFDAQLNEKRCVCGTGMLSTSEDGTPVYKCPKCGHIEPIPYEGVVSLAAIEKKPIKKAGVEIAEPGTETEPATTPEAPPKPKKPNSPIRPVPGIQPKPKAETTVEPTTEPKAPPAEPVKKPGKPSTPIRPTPGIQPKPKGFNNDIELFLKKRNLKESQHSHEKCMDCSAKPTKEVLWANGHGHAWFCDKHYAEWKQKDGKDDICGVKAVKDGKAATKFADNKNPKIPEAKDIFKGASKTELQKRGTPPPPAEHSYKEYRCLSCKEQGRDTVQKFKTNHSGHIYNTKCPTGWHGVGAGEEWECIEEAKINEQDPLRGVHPQKKEFIRTGDETLNKILPELSPEEQRYLVTIASETYADTVRRAQEYTGIEIKPTNYPALVQLMFQALQAAKDLESSHTRQLEEMALDLVFSVPEFKVVEEAYLADELGFDIKLGDADLTKLTSQEEEKPEEGLQQDEELNLALADTFKGMTDEDVKRRFSNLMITGGSVNKLYLFNMAREKLARIDEDLPAYYGILASMAQLGYWITPFGIEQAAAGRPETSAGSEEVIPKGDKYVIKVRGTTFPYLVHELVKGIYEYLALDPSHQIAMQKDKLEDETKDMLAGPGIYKAIANYIPADRQEILPIVQKKLTALEADEIRDVLANNPNGRRIMDNLINAAETELGTYRKQKEEYQA